MKRNDKGIERFGFFLPLKRGGDTIWLDRFKGFEPLKGSIHSPLEKGWG